MSAVYVILSYIWKQKIIYKPNAKNNYLITNYYFWLDIKKKLHIVISIQSHLSVIKKSHNFIL